MTRQSDLSHPSALIQQFVDQQAFDLDEHQLANLLSYCQLIMRWNRLTSLVQAKNLVALVEGHIIDCLAALGEIIGPNVVDVGSGAGLPGLVFAIAKPRYHYYLIEANQRRTRFLTQVTIELGLDNVTVINARVEDWQPMDAIQCITSRAYSALDDFYRDCCHLLAKVPGANESAIINAGAFGGTRLVALKWRIDPHEIAALPVSAQAIRICPLSVPGREHRNLVIIE